jgi:hypothetical protein
MYLYPLIPYYIGTPFQWQHQLSIVPSHHRSIVPIFDTVMLESMPTQANEAATNTLDSPRERQNRDARLEIEGEIPQWQCNNSHLRARKMGGPRRPR